MPGPGAPRPLASDADRERLVALLREHYAVGLFGLDELDHRVETVLSARFLDEAAAAVTDLPASASPGTAPSSAPSSGPPTDHAPSRRCWRSGRAWRS